MKFLDSIKDLLIKVVSMTILIFVPIHPVMIAVSVLIILDMVTGLWAAIKRKEKITSTGLKKTVVKTFLYQCSVMVAYLMETYLLDGVPVVKVVTGIIAITEGKSFFENVHAISGIDFWSEAINRIQSAAAKNTQPRTDEVIQIEKPKKKRKKRKSKK